MTTPSWQDSIPQRKMRSVQLATALFSLARFYVESPHSDVLARFTDSDMASTWPLRDAASLAALADLAAAGESAFVLNAEFNALFGPDGLLWMTESEMTGKDPLPLVQCLARQYKAAGFAAQKTEGFPRDHLAVELGFLAHLVVRGGDGVVAEIAQFRADHLDQYADTLLDAIDAAATTVTYRAVAQLTRAALAGVKELTNNDD
ncbi:molecular chaperone TorD family protein [Trueperella pyogenes]|uniref:TorD/DmsD family molecular chaperone n=1 Tax=Trueperella pyogenes TaxID=1661 RepID=UPI002168D65E|nr:molecular chaperone TorD family protein [Trueperella pyogenes]UVJ54485.1 molecular chaperone TorD family protein [Trueperella pyogenes]